MKINVKIKNKGSDKNSLNTFKIFDACKTVLKMTDNHKNA